MFRQYFRAVTAFRGCQMADTSQRASPFRHHGTGLLVVGIASLIIGALSRMLATRGELWLDELWSLLHVTPIANPFEIFTKVKHDNNHLLNSLWMWICVQTGEPSSFNVRLPSLVCGIALLIVLLKQTSSAAERATNTLWLVLVACSYPVTLYCSEARGYSLVLLCAVIGYRCLDSLLRNPEDDTAIKVFGVAGVVGCLSHAIYVLFLAPALAWLFWRAGMSPLKHNSRNLIRYGMLPPVVTASILTLTFYTGMEIGGGPLLPYLEVAATTISVAFGGVALSSVNVDVTGWSLFFAITVVTVCALELVAWIRSGDPRAILVTLILTTPWIAVAVLQPHFILPRYFIIQVVFAYLVAARFLVRLSRQGSLGVVVCATLVAAYVGSSGLHISDLVTRGRSHFVEIFATLGDKKDSTPITVGGDQDFQNSLRLAYAGKSANNLTYVPNYRTSVEPPTFVIRESLDAYEEFPRTFSTTQGVRYEKVKSYKAPLLNGSHVSIYQLTRNPRDAIAGQ